MLARERARRAVVDAVAALADPYRTTIVLRFYDGLPPREVARRMNVPVETVRTRTRRAVKLMRAQLEHRHGPRWTVGALLAPLSVEPSAGAAVYASLGGGTLIMAQSTRSALLAFVVLLALGGAGLLWWHAMHDEPTTEQDSVTGAGLDESQAVSPTLATRRPAPGALPDRPAPPEGPRSARPRGVLRGIVQSGRTHEPLAGATVRARMKRGEVPAGMTLDATSPEGAAARTDAQGRFVFPSLPAGAWQIDVKDSIHGQASEMAIAGNDPPWMLLFLTPPKDTSRHVRVRVVDAHARPVEGARVRCVLPGDTVPREGVSDEAGLAAIPLGDAYAGAGGWVTATASQGTGRVYWHGARRNLIRSTTGPQEVVLAATGSIRGRVTATGSVDVAGKRVVAASLVAWSSHGVALEHQAVTNEEGAFRFDDLPAGRYTMFIEPPPGWRMDLDQGTAQHLPDDWKPLTPSVDVGAVTVCDLPLVPGATLRGRVLGPEDRPLANCRVEVLLPQGNFDYPERSMRAGVHLWRLDSPSRVTWRSPLTFRTAVTDAQGRYEFVGLFPGPHRVRVLPDRDLSFEQRESVVLHDGRAVDLEHRLQPAGTLELTGQPFDSLGVRRRGADSVTAAFITPQGSVGAVMLPGLAVGPWEVVKLHSDPALPQVPIASFTVREGAVTYVDVSNAGNTEVRLVVRDAGHPVAGAWVTRPGRGQGARKTDEDGVVSWRTTTFGRTWNATVLVDVPLPDVVSLEGKVPVDAGEIALDVPPGAIRLTVRHDDGRPAAHATVTLRAKRRVRRGGAGVYLGTGTHDRTTDTHGVATWRGVPPGTYELMARLPSGGARVTTEVTVADMAVDVQAQAPPSGAIRVRVLHEDGRPAIGIPVGISVVPRGAPPPRHGPGRKSRAVSLNEQGWQTDADGVFLATGVPAGTATVYAWVMPPGARTASHNARAEVSVAVDDTLEVTLRLLPLKR